MKDSLAYSIRTRKTATKGIVYDVIFRIENENCKTIQKVLSGYKTKALAKAAYVEFMKTYIVPSNRAKAPISYESAMNEYIQYLKQTVKESTQYDFVHSKERCLDLYFKGNLREWTKQDVYYFIDRFWASTYDGKPHRQKYLTHMYGFFKTFYEWARQRYNLDDILKDIKLPKKHEQKFEYKIWTENEFNTFISVVDWDKYKVLFSTLYYSGVRCGELQALKVEDYVDGSLHITKTFSKKTMNGEAYNITETKNYKTRFVPLPNKLIVLLDEFVKDKPKDRYLFGNEHPLSSNAITTAYNKYVKLSNVTRIRIHDFRHSYVSLLMSKGANFGVIASLIGDTLEQVVKTYAHSTEEDKMKIISLL